MIAYHHFVNHTPDRAGRVYSLWLQQDLFGQWTLIRVRGGRQREPVLHSQVVESQVVESREVESREVESREVESREVGGIDGGAVGESTAAAWVCGEHKDVDRSGQ